MPTRFEALLAVPLMLALSGCPVWRNGNADDRRGDSGCSTAGDCAVGFTCDVGSGECIASPVCTSDASCGAGKVCGMPPKRVPMVSTGRPSAHAPTDATVTAISNPGQFGR